MGLPEPPPVSLQESSESGEGEGALATIAAGLGGAANSAASAVASLQQFFAGASLNETAAEDHSEAAEDHSEEGRSPRAGPRNARSNSGTMSPPLEEGNVGTMTPERWYNAARGGIRVHPRFGSKVPCTGRLEGQFKKLPNDEHHDNMRLHTRSCRHASCSRVWTGPWGTFIGGDQGSTHFDLTDCPEGKKMNEQIGWNYEDPRC